MVARDILFISLAVCAVVATFFFAWFALALIRIVRGVASVIEEVRARIEHIGSAIESLTERVTHSTASLSAVAAGVKELLGWLGKRRTGRRARSKAEDEAYSAR